MGKFEGSTMRFAWLCCVCVITVVRVAMGEDSTLPEPRVSQKILILPFDNHSQYDGPWDLSRGVAKILGDVLKENPFYAVIPFDSLGIPVDTLSIRPKRMNKKPPPLFTHERALEIGRMAGADYVFRGVVKDFSFSRFRAGLPVAGYSSHGAYVQIEVVLMKTIDGQDVGKVTGEGDVNDRDLGSPLIFSSDMSKRETEYYEIGKVVFGSAEFQKTLLGNALMTALHQAREHVQEVIKPPEHLRVSSPKVVWVGEDGIYINVGVEDGIEVGDKLGVYVEGDEMKDPLTGVVLGRVDEKRIAIIQVTQVKASHFSKAKVLHTEGSIPVNAAVRVEVPADTMNTGEVRRK